jgi:hypothetical protein
MENAENTSDERERLFEETVAWVSKLKTPWLRDELLAELFRGRQDQSEQPEGGS